MFAYKDLVDSTPMHINIVPLPQPQTTLSLSLILDTNPTITSSIESTPHPVTIKRSTREFRPPIWHKNYVTKAGSSKYPHSIASVLDYTCISP